MLPAPTLSRIASEFRVPSETVAFVDERVASGDPLPYLLGRFPEKLEGQDLASLRRLRARIEEARDIEARRANLLKTLETAGSDAERLRPFAMAAHDRVQLEDVAAALRHPKGTRGAEAAAKGLDALADAISSGALDGKTPVELAAGSVNAEKGVATPEEALAGAALILAERYAGDPEVRARVRREMRERGEIVAKAFDPAKAGADRYRDLFDHRERGKSMAARRYQKIRQGEREKVLKVAVEIPAVDELVADLEKRVLGEPSETATDAEKAAREVRRTALRDAATRILPGAIELDVRTEWKERADLEQIATLRRAFRALLMRPPFGPHPVVGVDPGARKGLRVAAVGPDGALLADATLLHEGDDRAAALQQARELLEQHGVRAIAVGSSESGAAAAAFFREVITGMASPPELVRSSEAGVATVANSAAAREELGEKPVPVRAAVSMARRLQDPLGELVRVEPRTLLAGHRTQDLARGRLDRMLAEETEACVHEVPVDLNRASDALLARVGAMGAAAARAIVDWRRKNGPFPSKVALGRVEGLDAAVYERASAFVRVAGSEEPLDSTGIHPAHADAAARLAEAAGAPLRELIGQVEKLATLDLAALATETIPASVLSVVRDRIAAGDADSRGPFLPTPFREDVRWLGDLKPGMELEAVVRRIAAYGVFVDLGITQEGLVHVSELADRFVKDPGEVVRIGERVKVRVLEVEPAKRKISLTMRSEEARKKAEEEREARRAARQRVRERRRRAVETAAAAPPAADGSAAPAIVPEGAPVEGAPPGDRPRRPSRFRDRPERRPMPVTRAASTRRDGLVGGRGRRNDFGPRRGGGKGDRRRDDEFVDDAGDAKGKAPQKREAPPQNAFAKFFQSHGLAEADRPAEAEAVAPAKPDEA